MNEFAQLHDRVNVLEYKLSELRFDMLDKNSLIPKPLLQNEYILLIYGMARESQFINLGDYIQTLAIKNALEKIFPNPNFDFWDRDNLRNYVPKENTDKSRICVMQGFFPCVFETIPNSNITPLYLGFHIGGDFYIDKDGTVVTQYENKLSNPEKLWRDFYIHHRDFFYNKTFGCRDLRTKGFFESLGVDSYFSRCYSLTLPKREELPSQTQVFIACRDWNSMAIPLKLKDSAISLCPEINIRDLLYNGMITINTVSTMFEYAQCQLEIFRTNAKVVITDRIHIAAPAIAMGIPTVIIKSKPNDPRYDIFKGIAPVYSLKDIVKKSFNFEQPCPDFEDLKALMLLNLKLSIESTYKNVDCKDLEEIRREIENFNILKDKT